MTSFAVLMDISKREVSSSLVIYFVYYSNETVFDESEKTSEIILN